MASLSGVLRTLVLVVGVGACALTGQPCRADSPPRQVDLSRFPATRLEDVVVPLPSEVFNVLDKLGTPDWKGELRPPSIAIRGPRPQIALLLGAVVAEGFVAVEAADREQVKQIGRDVLELARAIGVEKTVLSRTNAILYRADARDWRGVRQELDGALTDVKNAMIELKDAQLAHLVSLGGWLRGTEVLTSIVTKSYSPDSADLLNQPDLLHYFQETLAGMPARLRNNQLVSRVEKSLAQISPLISQKTISPASVKRINEITSQVVRAISSNA
ncbi:MAG: hypothetical protein JO069_18370 [Verrucomicrobia bacterium]|nr:hypothetical protein [Verrucomicrobiota bacterium]